MKYLKEYHHDVGIISYNINTSMNNFGAALHSYAFQKYLSKIGIESVIVNYHQSNFRDKLWKTCKEQHFWGVVKALSMAYKRFLFINFFKKYCVITKKSYNKNTIVKLDSINRFCCETDVTWCAIKGIQFDRAFMCDFLNMKNKENVAYSVDFGSNKISPEKAAVLEKYAHNFKYISIRNPFRLEEFKQIIGRNDVIVTIDPVFLLDKDDYKSIIKKPNIKRPYVVVYNCKENNPEMVKMAKEFAKKQGLKIITINCYDKNIINYIDSIPTPIGIEEFLGYIRHCEYLFTNSYHGICFAIIFAKQFYAFSRKANDGKIQTILSLFDFMDRKISSTPTCIEKIDYTNIDTKIKEIRKDSENFIAKSFINKIS